ncbi:MAG: M20/M25/M40 family metallo-hydrolase [Casimicrobiaceae bacterium]|nr:M20/M25/M40 family metallo-hydrolase [Casimicrobiaceae bacterium]MCX8099243.1 M20/M25/M40 family metallo-hydrolase [Casimicrobiaceae bacterium]MDW8312764.1 M20/M25/M40 family metallo-hydrolase [Burkholderiales bacterium]
MSSEFIARFVDSQHSEQVEFLRTILRVPSDTPPGDNAAAAECAARLIEARGFAVERHVVPRERVQAYGMRSITNLIVRERFGRGRGPTIALNAHGDVVPPGEGWTHDPYGAEVVDGRLYGRGVAVSKSDIATFTFALEALRALAREGMELDGAVELHFTYDEEFGGLLGPGWLLEQGLTRPDLVIGPGFSYQIVTAHNGCLQLEVSVHGQPAHGAMPETGHDALVAATAILNALYTLRETFRARRSQVPGITHPTLIVGRIEGGTNTNVVPGKVILRLDRRLIPEESPAEAEAELRQAIAAAVAAQPGIRVEVRRLLLAQALRPLPGHDRLVAALQRHAERVFGEPIPVTGVPLYTDARLYGEAGIPVVLYGTGPRTVLESGAKRADEHIVLEDLRRATQVVGCALADLLRA